MNTEDKFRQPHPQQEVPQYYHYPPQHHMPQQGEDELSLIELWRILIRYKWLIILVTGLSTLVAGYYASILPTVYRAEVLMVSANGGGGSSLSGKLGGLASLAGIGVGGGGDGIEQQMLTRLKTRSFIVQHVKEYNLKPILFAERWSQQRQEWLYSEPSNSEVYNRLNSMISISKDENGLVRLGIEWKNPDSIVRIADIANDLVASMNMHAKREATADARKSILFLEAELERTSLVDSRAMLYNLIEGKIKKIMMANVLNEFVFKVIDPAVVPEEAEIKPVLMIVVLGILLGLFGSILLVFTVDYSRK